jgi:transposase
VEAGQDLDHQPGSGVCAEKSARDRLIRLAAEHPDWALGFEDETWWSRLALPALRGWAEADRSLRLVERAVAKGDPDPKAAACYGVQLRRAAQAERTWLRFVDGRPVSAVTREFLDWCCARLEREGVRVWALVWDNASWHISKAVRAWVRAHNRRVKREGRGVRLLVCCLPTKSPWLNPIEGQWARAKRVVVEAERLLTAQELADRVCAHFGCPHEPHLIQEKAS